MSFPTGSFQRVRTNRKASRYSEEGTTEVATGSNPRSHARLGSPFSMYVCSTSSVEHTAAGSTSRRKTPGLPRGWTHSRSCLENRDNYLWPHYAPYCSTNTLLSTYTYIPWVVEGYRTPGWGRSKSILL